MKSYHKLEDVKRLEIHQNIRPEHPDTILRSIQLGNLDIGFIESKEIYHIIHNGHSTVKRGCHAHKIKQEIFQVVQGSCIVTVKDGFSEIEIELTNSKEVLYVPNTLWHEISFKEPTILFVISSTMYSEKERALDYIEDFEEFKKFRATFSQ